MERISFELDKNGIAIIRFDNPDSLVNKLSREDMEWMLEFLSKIDGQLDMIENQDEIKAVVLYSEKKESFLNGAATGEYLDFTLADEGRVYSLRAQEIAERIESSRAPFVSAVRGACLGIGLELNLASAYRVASNLPGTRFSLNDIDAGLIPCAGGTQRLPRLIGTRESLDMILSVNSKDSTEALELGLIDEVVPDEMLLDISVKRALEISNKELKPKRSHFKGIQHTIVNENPIARKKLFGDFKKHASKVRKPSMNAPLMAIEAVEVGMSSFNRGLHVESVYFGELVVSTVTRNLIRTRIALDLVKEKLHTSPEPVSKTKKIAVVGVKDSASRIISLAADSGTRVRFKGKNEEEVGAVLKQCYKHFKEKYDRDEIDELYFEEKFGLVSGTTDYSGFKQSRIIFECLDEDLKIKLEALKVVEPLMQDDAIYVSTSYVYPAAGIGANSIRPQNIIGLRIFDDAENSELMEISVTENTSEPALSQVIEFAKSVKKLPIVVRGSAGPYTTRLQLAYFNECLHLVSEGNPVENIEEAITKLGFREAPFRSMDKIGIDLILQASNIIYQVKGDKIKPNPSLGLLVSNERLGIKNGQGFYKYQKDHAKFDKSVYKFFPVHSEHIESAGAKEIQERLLLVMINEALYCLEEGVIGSPYEGDVLALLGLGFPSVIGGPFNYIDSEGAGDVLKKLHNLSVKYGLRFISPVMLKEVSAGNKKFYDI